MEESVLQGLQQRMLVLSCRLHAVEEFLVKNFSEAKTELEKSFMAEVEQAIKAGKNR